VSVIQTGTDLAFTKDGSTLIFAQKRPGGMKVITELFVYVAIAAIMSALAVGYLEEVMHVFYY
jgi:hypothetical protein